MGVGGMPARDGNLRPSASLQDFSVYRNGSLPSGLPKSQPVNGSSSSSFPNQQVQKVQRADGGGPVLTTIKSNLLRRSSGSLIGSFSHNSWFKKRIFILGIGTLIGSLLFLIFLWGKTLGAQAHLEYAVVIDCGSTGTRVHVYGWTHDGKESLPVMVYPSSDPRNKLQRSEGAPSFEKKQGEGRPYKRMETEPGLDKLLHNESGVVSAIKPLVDWAVKQIPETAHKKTQLFFLATAGLRRLPQVDAQWLLDRAWYYLSGSPFLCRRDWIRVISGQEEAYYGWIALNYNRNRLGYSSKQQTLGALDLGGSSLEVTFEPSEVSEVEYSVNVSVGSVEHHLYAHSHAGFGLNDAFEKSVTWLLEHNSSGKRGEKGEKGLNQVVHPCLNSGYKEPFVCSSHCPLPKVEQADESHEEGRNNLSSTAFRPQIQLVGKPNWTHCQSLVQSVINMSRISETPEVCSHSSCALGNYQPQPQGQFFALTGFYVVYKFFGLTSSNSLDDLLHKGQQFCKLEWEEAQQSVASQPSIDRYCFRAPYVVALVRQGLHLNDNQVLMGSGDFAWTLGAALNEAGALLPASTRGREKAVPFPMMRRTEDAVDLHAFTFLFVVILVALVLITYTWRWISSHPWRRPYLPLFVRRSVSSGPFSWFPFTFCCQGNSSGAVAGQPGDGRMKQPHSPAPSDSKNSFHHQMFGSATRHGGGDGPVLECDGLQAPSSAGTTSTGGKSQVQLSTMMMQQKGGSRLQSRRSQSREDLSTYVPPENAHIIKLIREVSPVRNFIPLRHDFTI